MGRSVLKHANQGKVVAFDYDVAGSKLMSTAEAEEARMRFLNVCSGRIHTVFGANKKDVPVMVAKHESPAPKRVFNTTSIKV